MKSMVQALKLVKSIVTRVRVIRRVNSMPKEIEVDLRRIVPGDVIAIASMYSYYCMASQLNLFHRW